MPLAIGPDDDPVAAMRRWYRDAERELPPDEAHAMALASVDERGAPSVRVILCRRIDDDGGLVFYTNYRSRKSRELDATGRAAVVFHWRHFGRQLRVEGTVSRGAAADSDAYWATRPPGSQVSAVASPQSDRVESPAALEAAAAAVRERHADGAVPRPAWWGGFVLTPTAIELWVEGAARLHERLRFEKTDDGWRGAYIGP